MNIEELRTAFYRSIKLDIPTFTVGSLTTKEFKAIDNAIIEVYKKVKEEGKNKYKSNK